MRPALMNPRLNGGAEGEDSTVDLGTGERVSTASGASGRGLHLRPGDHLDQRLVAGGGTGKEALALAVAEPHEEIAPLKPVEGVAHLVAGEWRELALPRVEDGGGFARARAPDDLVNGDAAVALDAERGEDAGKDTEVALRGLAMHHLPHHRSQKTDLPVATEAVLEVADEALHLSGVAPYTGS